MKNAKGNHWYVRFNKLRLMLISKAHRILFQKEFVKINNIVVHTGNNVIYFKAPKSGKNILISYSIPNDQH